MPAKETQNKRRFCQVYRPKPRPVLNATEKAADMAGGTIPAATSRQVGRLSANTAGSGKPAAIGETILHPTAPGAICQDHKRHHSSREFAGLMPGFGI